MKFTTTITTLTAAVVLLGSPFAVSAQTVTPTANAQSRLSRLHTICDNEIDKRLASLNKVATRISGLKKLSDDQKNTFSGEITTDVNALTALKAKCDADTDVPTLRGDVKSIVTTYRIYAEFLPQLNRLVASDTMGVTADKLSQLATKLQERIEDAGNPSNLTSLLSDMQAKIADAKIQYSNAESQIASFTPQSYNSDPTGVSTTLKTALSEIHTGVLDLRTAVSDARQIIQALKALKTTPSPTTTQ